MDDSNASQITVDLQRALVKESLTRRAQMKNREIIDANNPVPYRCHPALDSIITICTEKLGAKPNHSKALSTRASAYLRKEMYEEAIQDCETILANDPDSIQAYYIKGCVLEKLGQINSSIDCFTRVLELDPSHVNAALTRAACFNRLGQFSEACEDYSKALEVDKQQMLGVRQEMNGSRHTSKSTSVSTTEEVKVETERKSKVMTVSIGGEMNAAGQKYLQGCAAKKKGDYHLAVQLLSECIIAQPTHFKALFNRAFVYDRLGDLENALTDYTSALVLEPKNAYAYYNRGILLQRLGKIFVAIEDFTSAIHIDNKKSEFFNNRGFLFYKLEQYQEAAEDFSSALRLEAKHIKARLKRARCFERLSNFQEAKSDYEKAWEQEKGSSKVPIRLARVLVQLARFQEANTVLEQVKSSLRSSAKWWSLKAETSVGLGDSQQALIAFSHSLAMEPWNVSTRLSRAKTLTQYQSHIEAIEDCDTVLSTDFSNVLACVIKTEANLKLGNVSEALKVTESVSNSSRLWFLRGYAFALSGALTEAQTAFSTALKIDPEMSAALHNRGVCHFLRKEFDSALADFSAELQLTPAFELAYFCRGLVYERLEAPDQAIVDYETALKFEQKASPEFLLSCEL